VPTSIAVAGDSLELLSSRAAYWPRRRTLLIADVHVGKAAAFRAAGVPIPRGTTEDDLARISGALAETGADRLVVLGDLYHAKEGMAAETLAHLAAWRREHSSLAVEIVLGNHDRRAGPSPDHLAFIEFNDPVYDPPFVLRHDPVPHAEGYVLAGHVHPSAVLRGRGVRAIRLPCFHFGERVGVLPAFGVFTGTSVVRPRRNDRVFVVTEEEVVEAVGRGA
jgi:DNA ligase-associated metallophosphoesterase